MNILEAIYALRIIPWFKGKMNIQDLFESGMVDDYTVDIMDCYNIEEVYERYHHNTVWCDWAIKEKPYPRVQDEFISDNHYLSNEEEIHHITPLCRIKISLLTQIIQWERDNVNYELYLKFCRKYIHVKGRIINDDKERKKD